MKVLSVKEMMTLLSSFTTQGLLISEESHLLQPYCCQAAVSQHSKNTCAPPPTPQQLVEVALKDVHLPGLVMKDAHLPGLVTHAQKQLSKSNDLCSGPPPQEFFVNSLSSSIALGFRSSL